MIVYVSYFYIVAFILLLYSYILLFTLTQVPEIPFNRALLFNIGFVESLKQHNYSCFIFHDVDLIPENDNNLYTCTDEPRHLSVAIDKHKYR